MKNKLSRLVVSANFEITAGEGNPFKISCNEFFNKQEGVIIIGTIVEGEVSNGTDIIIQHPNDEDKENKIFETIVRIEKGGAELLRPAKKGEKIGMCLSSRVGFEELIKFNIPKKLIIPATQNDYAVDI